MAELRYDFTVCIASGGKDLAERITALLPEYSPLCREYFDSILAKYKKPTFTQSACGLLLLDNLLQKNGIDRKTLEIVRNSDGRPCVINRRDADFSISHSEGAVLACLALGADAEVGADIQRVRTYTNEHLETLARSFMDEAELNGYLAATERERYFYTAWTRREALFKRSGSYHGLNSKPDAVRGHGFFETAAVNACGKRYYYSISIPQEED